MPGLIGHGPCPLFESIENVPPVGVCARQVQRQPVTFAVDDDPLRAVVARDREVAPVRVEAIGVAQALLGPVLLRHGDVAEWGVREIHRRVSREQVAGFRIREEDILRLRVGADGTIRPLVSAPEPLPTRVQ